MRSSRFSERVWLARKNRQPLLAFNAFDIASITGVLAAARRADAPVIVQFSARTVTRFGAESLASVTRAAARRIDADAFVHLDHCRDDALLASAVEARFDGIMVDGSHLESSANARWTREWVDRAHSAEIVVEAEYSAIRGEEDGLAGGETLTPLSASDFLSFAEQTGADLIGADVGTAHGHYAAPPRIDYDAIASLADAAKSGFVIHGGSGLEATVLRRLASLGVAKINFSTDLKDAWASGLASDGTEREPLALLSRATDAVERMAAEKMVFTYRTNN